MPFLLHKEATTFHALCAAVENSKKDQSGTDLLLSVCRIERQDFPFDRLKQCDLILSLLSTKMCQSCLFFLISQWVYKKILVLALRSLDHKKLYGCHQYFLITISSTQHTPVSNWSNRRLLSGGNTSCSWVFCSCTGPKWWGGVTAGLHPCLSYKA